MLNFDKLAELEIAERQSLISKLDPASSTYHVDVTSLRIEKLRNMMYDLPRETEHGRYEYNPVFYGHLINYLKHIKILNGDDQVNNFNIDLFESTYLRTFKRKGAIETGQFFLEAVNTCLARGGDEYSKAYQNALVKDIIQVDSSLEGEADTPMSEEEVEGLLEEFEQDNKVAEQIVAKFEYEGGVSQELSLEDFSLEEEVETPESEELFNKITEVMINSQTEVISSPEESKGEEEETPRPATKGPKKKGK